MSRITLISYFEERELNKIFKIVDNIDFKMCKVPYGINDEKRYEIDNLPYHVTIFATNKANEKQVLDILNDLNVDKIILKINEIKIMDGRNNSNVLYLGIEQNDDIKNLQRLFYEKIPEEKYNPDNFVFHITMHIDNNKHLIYNLYKKLQANFKPFFLEFNTLALYNYPGDIINITNIYKTIDRK